MQTSVGISSLKKFWLRAFDRRASPASLRLLVGELEGGGGVIFIPPQRGAFGRGPQR